MYIDTIKYKKEISTLFLRGKIVADKNMLIKVLKNRYKCNRVLFAVSKKKGNKPKRNRQIRRMRAIARETDVYTMSLCLDIAIIILRIDATSHELWKSFSYLMQNVNKGCNKD